MFLNKNYYINFFKNLPFLRLVFIILINITSTISYGDNNNIKFSLVTSELKPADIIFWVNENNPDISSHVAMVYKSDNDPKKIKIIHATNSPKYYKIAATRLKSLEELKSQKKIFRVFRIKDETLSQKFLKNMSITFELNVKYSKKLQDIMENFNSLTSHYSMKTRLKIQNIMFDDIKNNLNFLDNTTIYKNGTICSHFFINSMIAAFLESFEIRNDHNNSKNSIPNSLKMDPFFTNSEIILYSLSKDKENFEDLGLLNHNYHNYHNE